MLYGFCRYRYFSCVPASVASKAMPASNDYVLAVSSCVSATNGAIHIVVAKVATHSYWGGGVPK